MAVRCDKALEEKTMLDNANRPIETIFLDMMIGPFIYYVLDVLARSIFPGVFTYPMVRLRK